MWQVISVNKRKRARTFFVNRRACARRSRARLAAFIRHARAGARERHEAREERRRREGRSKERIFMQQNTKDTLLANRGGTRINSRQKTKERGDERKRKRRGQGKDDV